MYSFEQKELQNIKIIDGLNNKRLGLNRTVLIIPFIRVNNITKAKYRPSVNLNISCPIITFVQKANSFLHSKRSLTITYCQCEIEIIAYKNIHIKTYQPHPHPKVQYGVDLMVDREEEVGNSWGS